MRPWLPVLLGFLSAIGPISTDMYLPAFPAIEGSLGSAVGTAQVTMATWFAGLALGQLLQGALSDRFGRRAPLLAGTAIYAAASVGCAMSWDMGSLAGFRFLAALGGSASAVIPRAIVRDLTEGLASARLMSRLMLVMGAAPILAPSLGGLLLGVADWRAIFWVMAGYGVLSTLLVWRFLPDTLPPAMRARLSAVGSIARYLDVLRDRNFLSYALMGAAAMFAVFSYIAGAPTALIEGFGLSPRAFALTFAVTACGFIAASQLNPWLVGRFGAARTVFSALCGMALAATVLLGLSLLGRGGLWAPFAAVVVALACSGAVMPNAAVGALARHGARAGSASAMIGTIQFAVAACGAALAGLVADRTLVPIGALMLAGALAGLAAFALRPRGLPK